MNKQPALSDQIRKLNRYNLVTYLKLLGHKPSFTHHNYTVFPWPLDDFPGAVLIVDNKTNTFRVTFNVKAGTLMDLVRLLFHESPSTVLSDIARFRLDLLMSTQDAQPADQP